MSLNRLLLNTKKPDLNIRVNDLKVDGNTTNSGNFNIDGNLDITGALTAGSFSTSGQINTTGEIITSNTITAANLSVNNTISSFGIIIPIAGIKLSNSGSVMSYYSRSTITASFLSASNFNSINDLDIDVGYQQLSDDTGKTTYTLNFQINANPNAVPAEGCFTIGSSYGSNIILTSEPLPIVFPTYPVVGFTSIVDINTGSPIKNTGTCVLTTDGKLELGITGAHLPYSVNSVGAKIGPIYSFTISYTD